MEGLVEIPLFLGSILNYEKISIL